MNDDEEPRPEVGSVAEEAAKLMGALSDWAKDQGPDDAPRPPWAGSAAGLADLWREVDGHVAGENCTYCPLCRLIGVVRATSPEVRGHLGAAASSLAQAVASALADSSRGTRGDDRRPVQKIDLDGPWED